MAPGREIRHARESRHPGTNIDLVTPGFPHARE